MERSLSRRDFLASGLAGLTAVVAAPGLLPRILRGAPVVGDGPYGPLSPPDANGVMLPKGFRSRVIARSGARVAGTDYVWHDAPDGGACFPTPDDGWIYVSNSETGAPNGGVGAVRFEEDGTIVDAYRILEGTARNCSGGPTPWGTWLSCEEHERGRVWECDPTGKRKAVVHPALGVFTHEAAAVDPENQRVYLTEDHPQGRFYRFVPDAYPKLDAGRLEAARVAADGTTTWHRVPDPQTLRRAPTRAQVANTTRFIGGEGTWYDAGIVYFTTKGDNRVWAYDTRDDRISVLYDARATRDAPLTGVDNVTGSNKSGDIFVAEDGGDMEIVMITPEGTVARLLRVTGSAHNGSEIAGPAFDPSGGRLYFSSQRGYGRGVTFEVRGPFRTTRVPRTAAPTRAPLPLASEESDETNAPIGVIVGGAAAAVAGAAVAGRAITRGRRRRGAGRPDA